MLLYLLLIYVLLNSSICGGKMFGFNNSYTCHCQNNETCHVESGICSTRRCQRGWSGNSCQKQNVALQKPANQSGQENNQGPWFATDGNRADRKYTYCIDTTYSPWAWWLVDLQQTYPIGYITIYYRYGILYKFKGFSLTTIDNATRSSLCFTHTNNVQLTSPYTLRCNSEGRYINISNNKPEDRSNYLSLCEVEVYVCSVGTYGRDCEQFCHCSGYSRCHDISGACSNGCLNGWHGSSCNASCSTINAYGPGCRNSCKNRHCSGSVACNHVTGLCVDGCEVGYRESDCTQECHDGFYGYRCNESCSNRHCLVESSECNHVNGTCVDGCSAGYTSPNCRKECQRGFYGLNCQFNCSERFCLHMSSPCANVIGACEGGCLVDYIGSDCTTKLGNQKDSAIIISTTVTLVILLAGIAFFVFWRRHRPTKNNRSTATKNPQMGLVRPLPKRNDEENKENMYVNVAAISNGDFEVQIPPQNSDNYNQSNKFVNADDDNNESNDEDDKLSNDWIQKEREDIEYVNLPSSNSGLTADELEQYVDTMKATQGFKSLYAGLHSDWTATYNAAQIAENRPKNRYKGYYPYDHTRVILQKLPHDLHSDFINANYIDGFFRKKAYIAAQGATSITINDFVRMIWEQKCDKIIMLTKEYEMGKLKCDRYWPEHGSARFGSITLTLQEEKVRADFTIRYIKMTTDNLIHHFCQFHYTSWPDHGVPDTGDLLDFLFTVNRYKPKSTKPEIIHCSAGVGRTGTYIAVDYCLKQGGRTDKVDVLDLVKTIRNQRKGMIQTAHQLEFVFEALIYGLKHGDTSITKALFESSDTGLLASRRFSQHSQWEYLSSIETGNNEQMNRIITANGVPVCRFPSRTNINGYVLGEMQCLDTQSVWEIIMDQQTSIVLFIIDNTNEMSICQNFGSQETHGDLVLINTDAKKISEELYMISVTVSRPETEEETEVKLLVMYIDKSCGKHFKTAINHILPLIDELDRHHNSHDPLTLFYSDPTCGLLFCILRNIVQRLQLDDEVEIFSVIKKMHIQMGKTIKSQDEYREIHQCISDYIKLSGAYINL